MAIFDIFKKAPLPFPYRNEAINTVYHLLFCDNIDLYKKNNTQPALSPWKVLFAANPQAADLQQIIDDDNAESRTKILAYNQLRAAGIRPDKKELLAVIVEIGMDNGLDVLASFRDGTARYINQSERMIIWETADPQSQALTEQLFQEGAKVVAQIGPWHEARRPPPPKDYVRITFLVSDGLYFGEGPCEVLFSDPLGASALLAATKLMQYLTEKASNPN